MDIYVQGFGSKLEYKIIDKYIDDVINFINKFPDLFVGAMGSIVISKWEHKKFFKIKKYIAKNTWNGILYYRFPYSRYDIYVTTYYNGGDGLVANIILIDEDFDKISKFVILSANEKNVSFYEKYKKQ